jgi:hypothetical protein
MFLIIYDYRECILEPDANNQDLELDSSNSEEEESISESQM